MFRETQTRFSALQRAENSSIYRDLKRAFQQLRRFSALQRAENSSIRGRHSRPRQQQRFQCSSASRKFLNTVIPPPSREHRLFQCSSASRKFLNSATAWRLAAGLMFQCSSASRKFLNPDPRTCVHPYSRLRRSRFVVPEPSWCVAMTPVY